MRVVTALGACVLLIQISGVATAGSFCSGPEFTEDQIKEIIRRERFVRDGLSDQPADVQTKFRRRRCHYVYTEYGSLFHLTYTIN
jgi:hypothetical protein